MRHGKQVVFIFCMCLVLILAGCTDGSDLTGSSKSKWHENSYFCTLFNEAVAGERPTVDAQKAIDAHIDQMETDVATRLILRYEMLLEEKKAFYSNRIFAKDYHKMLYDTFPDTFDTSRVADVEDSRFRGLLEEMIYSGFILKRSDQGLYQVDVDYAFFKKYRHKLIPEINTYFDLMLLEKNASYFGDNAVEAAPEELAVRLEGLDAYINAYPKSDRLEAVSRVANSYLLSLVYGGRTYEPYDDQDLLKQEYMDAYRRLAQGPKDTLMREFFKGLTQVLEVSEGTWNESVYDYVVGFPEIYLKRHIRSQVYEDAFMDVGFGWTASGDLYYYPVISGIDNRTESGKLNLMARSVIEKRMLGRGIDGMYTGGKYIWTDFELTFNRRDWISIRYSIYTELPDGSSYWTTESLNYDLAAKRKIKLNDVMELSEERDIIDAYITAYFDKSQTLFNVSLEDFYKNNDPEFYLTDNGINILVPLEKKRERSSRVVEIFIPFEKFRTSVEYIYKMPVNQ